MAADKETEGIKERLSRQGEEALGRLAEELAANPVVSSALASVFEARERAVAAQEAAMGALGIPSAADIERLTRRMRSVSQRLEGIEDSLDRLDERLAGIDGLGDRLETVAAAAAADPAQDGVVRRLDAMGADLTALREALDPAAQPVPKAQERLAVTGVESPPAPRKKAASRGSRSRSAAGRPARGPKAGASRPRGKSSPGSGSK